VDREALLSGLVHPGGREPAPEPLRLVQGFVNTVDREHGPDLLAEPAGLEEWLGRHDLAAPVRAGDQDAARAVREALRSLLWANNGEPYDAAAADVLAGAARRAHLEPTFAPGEAALVPQAGEVDGAIGRILAVAFAAMLDGGWRRLKACPGHRCGWAFYDRSTNASATWCSMQVCGGRAKAGAYYRRRRGA
jgi:predicted RNA-binding Zn ribbon-like protein